MRSVLVGKLKEFKRFCRIISSLHPEKTGEKRLYYKQDVSPSLLLRKPVRAKRPVCNKIFFLRSFLNAMKEFKFFKRFKSNSQTSFVSSDSLKHENLVFIAVYQSCMQGWCEMNGFGHLCTTAHGHWRLRKGNNFCVLRKKTPLRCSCFLRSTLFLQEILFCLSFCFWQHQGGLWKALRQNIKFWVYLRTIHCEYVYTSPVKNVLPKAPDSFDVLTV